jgi:ubiquinone/menaquinone biosynthesis C-methylase UbiE
VIRSRLPFLRLLGLGLLEGDLAAVRRIAAEQLDHGGGTLELPCGVGVFSDLFEGADYVGVDPDRRRIDCARACRPGIFLASRAHQIEVVEGRFSQVLAYRLLDDMTDGEARAVIGELARVTAPGGRLLLIGAAPVSGHALLARLAARLAGVTMPRDAGRISALLAPQFVVTSSQAFASGFVRRVSLVALRA